MDPVGSALNGGFVTSTNPTHDRGCSTPRGHFPVVMSGTGPNPPIPSPIGKRTAGIAGGWLYAAHWVRADGGRSGSRPGSSRVRSVTLIVPSN